MTPHIALLRAIGGATHAKMTMKQLEAKLQAAGLPDTKSIIATGNFIIRSDWDAQRIAAIIDGFLAEAGIRSTVFMRNHSQFQSIVDANPFPEAARERPAQFLVVFTETRPADLNLAALTARATVERIARIKDEIAIDYNGRVSDTKLLPALVDKTLGCAGTARNWNTVMKLLEASA
jgi:uncharacterized protein (DUF1697 family)